MHNNEIMSFFSKFVALIDSILPIFFWLLIIYGFDERVSAGLTVISAIIHEAGHMMFYVFFSKKNKGIKGILGGFKITKLQELSYREEFFLSLLGPLANLSVCLFSFIAFLFSSVNYYLLFGLINFCTAFSNLLPIRGHDGYRCLMCIFKKSNKFERYADILDNVSFASIILLTFISLYLMQKFNGGYWVYVVFGILLYENINRGVKTHFFKD